MSRGFYWSKDNHSQNLARILESRITPAAAGILYLLRCMAGQAQLGGRVVVDGEAAKRPALLAWLKRQYGEDVTGPLNELFERSFLKVQSRAMHVVVVPWAEDQTPTPDAVRKREARGGKKDDANEDAEGSASAQGIRNVGVSKNRVAENDQWGRGCEGVDSPRTVRVDRERDRDRERENINTESEPEQPNAGARVLSFPSAAGRGFAPPSIAPCSGGSVRGAREEGEGNQREQREKSRGEREREEGSEEGSGSGGAMLGGANGETWQSVDLYQDPFRAAGLITGEYNPDASAMFKNGLRDLGKERFCEALAEVRQERAAGKAPKPGRLFAHVLNRYRAAAGIAPVHSRRIAQ